MSSITFTDLQTVIPASWLNQINSAVFTDLGGPGTLSTTAGSAKVGTPALSGVTGTTVAAQLASLAGSISSSGVSSFNTRTGAVTLTQSDTLTALSSGNGTATWATGNSGAIVMRWNFNNATATGSSFSIYRQANYTGGTAGFTNHALRCDTDVSANATSYEWGFTSVLNNYAAAGENVAGYFQGNRYAAVGCPTWGLTAEANDKNNASTTSFSAGLVGMEVDVFANGLDDYYRRVGVDVVVSKSNAGGAKGIAGIGVRVGAQNTDNTKGAFSIGFYATSGDGASFMSVATGVRGMDLRGTYSLAIDTSGSTNSTSTALRIKAGDYICMDGNDNYGFKINGTRLEFWNRIAGARHGYIDMTGADVNFNASAGGVTSFNTRTGAVTLSSADVSGVNGALTNATNNFTVYQNFNGGIVTAGVISNGDIAHGSYTSTWSSTGNVTYTATAGGVAYPANIQGFLNIKIDGTTYKLPFYNV